MPREHLLHQHIEHARSLLTGTVAVSARPREACETGNIMDSRNTSTARSATFQMQAAETISFGSSLPLPGIRAYLGPSSPPLEGRPQFLWLHHRQEFSSSIRKASLPLELATSVTLQPGPYALKGSEILHRPCRNVGPCTRDHSAQRMSRPQFQEGRGAGFDAALQATCPLQRL
jgi:hypothetical protein